jgi:large subunit ribosomal protein L7/L12
MAKMTGAELLDAFKEMTLLELSEFVKDFEDTFGVTAAVSVHGEPPAPPAREPEEDEQTEFEVVITATGDKKIQVIKEVRVFTRLGLKEAKDLVDRTASVPVTVLERADRETAQRALEALRAAGATVEVR